MIFFLDIIVLENEKFGDGDSNGDSYRYLKFEVEFKIGMIRSVLIIINIVMIKRRFGM